MFQKADSLLACGRYRTLCSEGNVFWFRVFCFTEGNVLRDFSLDKGTHVLRNF